MNVLSIGYDSVRLSRRSAILELEGYLVTEANTLLDAIPLLHRIYWNAVILDSSVSSADARLLAKLIHIRSTVPILLLASGSQFFDSIPGVEVFAGAAHDPNALVRAVDAVVSRRKGALVQ